MSEVTPQSILASTELFTLDQSVMLASNNEQYSREAAEDLGRQLASSVVGRFGSQMSLVEFGNLLLEEVLPEMGLSPETSDIVYTSAVNSFKAIALGMKELKRRPISVDEMESLRASVGDYAYDYPANLSTVALSRALGDTRGALAILK